MCVLLDFQRPVAQHRRVDKPFPGIWISLLLLLAVFAGQLGLGYLLREAMTVHALLLVGVVNLIVLGTVSAIGYALSREAPRWGRGSSVPATFVGALAVTVAGGVVALGWLADTLSRVLPLPPELARLLDSLLDGPPLEIVFSAVIVAPLTEELLFRGLILRGLTRRYGFLPAALVSSALFALSHLNLVQGLPAFAVGFYLAWLYRTTGTLWWPILGHGLFNGLSLLLALLFPDSSSVPNASPMPWLIAAAGAAVLGLGLLLTKRWAPLSPPGVSDKVAP